MRKILNFICLFSLVLLNTCSWTQNSDIKVEHDLPQIMQKGRITAITNFNSTEYFIYKGTPMGFQFELLERFAEYAGLELEIIASNNDEEMVKKLITGQCDIIATATPIRKELKKYVNYTEPIRQGKQVLVQRAHNISDSGKYINSVVELAGKTVIVQSNSSYSDRLANLSKEIGGDIDIVEVPEDQEQIVQFVAGGEIDYAVCDEMQAIVNQKYYPQLDCKVAISLPQNLSWAVRNNSPQLTIKLNSWLKQFKKTVTYANLYNKYYRSERSVKIVNSNYYAITTGRISSFDNEIKHFSNQLGWDWRLVSAIIYQESNFKPNVMHGTAYGLMQIIPETAKRFGVDSADSPAKNIKVGIKFLKWLNLKFEQSIPDANERIKFVLAAYNVGIGHVFDARALAVKYGKDPNIWNNVQYYLLHKSEPKYYNDPLSKFGYCRGYITCAYVSEVLSRYNHYKNIATIQ